MAVQWLGGAESHSRNTLVLESFRWTELKGAGGRVLSGAHQSTFYLSTECENLLKKSPILNSSMGGPLGLSRQVSCMPAAQEDEEASCTEQHPDYKDRVD